MKKNTIIILLSVLPILLASCRKDSAEENGRPGRGSEVRFSAVVGDKQADFGPTGTRVSGEQWDSGDAVGIFMLKEGEPLPGGLTGGAGYGAANEQTADNLKYTAAGNGALSPEGKDIYYPKSGKVDFVAYYPWKSTGSAAGQLNNYIYPVDLTDQSAPSAIDLLYSNNATGRSAASADVQLRFERMLSRLSIAVVKGEGMGEADFSTMTVTVGGTPAKAKFALATGTMSDLSVAEFAAREVQAGSAYDAIVVPQPAANQYAGRTVTFAIGAQGARENFIWKIPGSTLFEAGKSHLWTVTIGRNGITARESSVTEWDYTSENNAPRGIGVNNREELLDFASLLRTGGSASLDEMEEKYVYEGVVNIWADIALLDEDEWIPLYAGDGNELFDYDLNGNGHVISNVSINYSEEQANGPAGFVRRLGPGKTISNLTITGEVSCGDDSFAHYAGGIAGENYGTIRNCSFHGNVTGVEGVGGICGANVGGTITGCTGSGRISGARMVGGLCGTAVSDGARHSVIEKSSGSGEVFHKDFSAPARPEAIPDYYEVDQDGLLASAGFIGGICGYNTDNSVLTFCSSSAAVRGPLFVGGIAGASRAARITNCFNTGAVYGHHYVGGVCGTAYSIQAVPEGGEVGDNRNSGSVTGISHVGGITGAGFTARISSCENVGTIYGKQMLGGITGVSEKRGLDGAGYGESSVTQSTNRGNLIGGSSSVGGIAGYNSADSSIDNCHNYGDVNNGYVCQRAGGVCGHNDGAITDSGNSGAVRGDSSIGGVAGYSAGDITSCSHDAGGAIAGEGDYIGGIAGMNEGGTITHCGCYGGVSGAGSYVGGVAGSNDGNISECRNSGQITGSGQNTGGICGANMATINRCVNSAQGEVNGISYTGGICGRNSGTVAWCTNEGDLIPGSEPGYDRRGGICGVNIEGAEDPAVIEYSENKAIVEGNERVGGICGSNQGRKAFIRDCRNNVTAASGAIRGKTAVGGVCGFNDRGEILRSSNSSEVRISQGGESCGGICGENDYGSGNIDCGIITACFNTGTIRGEDGDVDHSLYPKYIGGLCGYNWSIIRGCYSTGAIYSKRESGFNPITMSPEYYYGVGAFAGGNNSLAIIAQCYWADAPEDSIDEAVQFDNQLGGADAKKFSGSNWPNPGMSYWGIEQWFDVGSYNGGSPNYPRLPEWTAIPL